MTRQVYRYGSSKQFFAFDDMSGGLNVRDANETLNDNEFRELQNVDLGARGSLPKRSGFKVYLSCPSANPQGYFRYFGTTGTVTHLIASDGSLWKDVAGTYTRITVQTYNETTGAWTADAAFRFQTALPIGGVQYGETMFFATGTKLLEYTGSVLRVVAPYKPTPTEIMKIGVNTLATNPLTYISVGSGSVLVNEGLTASRDIGIINSATTFTSIYSKPSGDSIEIKWEYKKSADSAWIVLRDFNAATTYAFTATEVGVYDIRTTIRKVGITDPLLYKIYVFTEYKIASTEENHEIAYDGIHTCTGVMMYYEQLLFYKSTANQNILYISDVYRPNYFPANNSLTFSDIKGAKLQALVKYYGILIVFTEDEIWGLSGQNPMNFSKAIVNPSIGCSAPATAKAVGNYVLFLSKEGLYKLKSVYNNDNRLNVDRLDLKIISPTQGSGAGTSYMVGTVIPNSMPTDLTNIAKASAIQFGDQYQLHFPVTKQRFRYYFEDLKAWTLDHSTKMEFKGMYVFDGTVYMQDYTTGTIFVADNTLYTDNGVVYDTVWGTKEMDLGMRHHKKKPKELLFQFQQHYLDSLAIQLYAYIDQMEVVSPVTYKVEVVNGEVIYTTDLMEENLISVPSSTAFGTWTIGESTFGKHEGSRHSVRLSGSGHTIKFRLVDNSNKFVNLLGYGIVAKISKPTA